jgi:hypothetical protein
MTAKYSFMFWENELYESYDEALQMALAILAHAQEKPDVRIMPSICIRYKNANGMEEYLFFGWNFE